MIRPGRLWWFLKRDLKRGFPAAYHHYFTVPKLLQSWRWTRTDEPPSVAVHVLTGAGDWQLCTWMLASWFQATQTTWKLVVHDDGTLPAAGQEALARMFPHVRFLRRRETDRTMAAVLAPYNECAAYRARHPLALKSFDVPHYAEGERFLLLDSDVLFFQHPTEIMAWVRGETGGNWFNADCGEGSLVSPEEAEEKLGVTLWPKVNTGLDLLQKDAIDYAFCERALTETNLLQGHIWRVEQTLIALCCARRNQGGLLPKTYEVSLGKYAAPDAIARHYVGAVRDRFYAEGIPRVTKLLGI